MSGGFASSGFEIDNALDRRAFPAARRRRTGPPPSGLPPGFDPAALRGVPIRTRNSTFAMIENGERAVAAFGPYVGPGLVKRIEFTHTTTGDGNPNPHFNLFVNTAPYVSAVNVPLATLPAGTAIFDHRIARDDVNNTFAAEGGLTNMGQVINATRFLLDYYVSDAQFFVALVMRATAGQMALAGKLLVYEGVLPSDFPAILG